MAKQTKALSGAAKRKYFRESLQADPGVTAEAAERLTEKFAGELSHLRVRRPPLAADDAADAHEADQAAGEDGSETAAPAFDPHQFSLIVVMTREGADGLKKRLAAVDNAEHLRALARAQHVAIDATIDELAALRSAIVAGTAQRIADRRAAAS